ncbi:MAG: hypothetical protein RLZ98_1270 [Pseudomonadota bacterium]|jgi:secondary thiamine-phosphate synthase enzyme
MTEAPLRQIQGRLVIGTQGAGFTDLSQKLGAWLRDSGCGDGLVSVFVRHTSASLTIQENADPSVLADLADALDRLAPREMAYRHRTEGPDDMPAHIRSMLTSTSVQIPVADGTALLGTWQALYLIEHRDEPHRREIVLHFIGTIGR